MNLLNQIKTIQDQAANISSQILTGEGVFHLRYISATTKVMQRLRVDSACDAQVLFNENARVEYLEFAFVPSTGRALQFFKGLADGEEEKKLPGVIPRYFSSKLRLLVEGASLRPSTAKLNSSLLDSDGIKVELGFDARLIREDSFRRITFFDKAFSDKTIELDISGADIEEIRRQEQSIFE